MSRKRGPTDQQITAYGARVASAQLEHLAATSCGCGAELPSRARIQIKLSAALEHLNGAVKGGLDQIERAQRFAALGHALLSAISMCERCEQCTRRRVETAARELVERALAGKD